jgi:hypothetical protein
MTTQEHIEILSKILNSDFAAQKEHFEKTLRAEAKKSLVDFDLKAFRSFASSHTQSEIIDNLLSRRFTIEMIAEELVTTKKFNDFKTASKRVKRHVKTFVIHYQRKNREIFESAK